MSDPDIILVSQSNVVDYDAYSKLPLDRLDLFKSLVYPRMVHHEGQFRSQLDYLNFKTHGKAYAAADYPERRRMLNIWNLPSASGVHLSILPAPALGRNFLDLLPFMEGGRPGRRAIAGTRSGHGNRAGRRLRQRGIYRQ